MRHAILVLGMHRSGTSALAGALVRLGIAPPRTLMPATSENERGYFESVAFMTFHDTILAAAGSSWDDWQRLSFPYKPSFEAGYRIRAIELLREEFGDASVFVLKDPRACRLVPFWLRTFQQTDIVPHVVIPFRSPVEVAKSLAARDARMPFGEGIALWLRHALDAEYDSRGTARSFVLMDNLLVDWRSTLARMARDLDLSWPVDPERAGGEIDAFLSPSLKHHDTLPGTALVNWADNAFQAFSALVHDPTSTAAQSTLDAIRFAFEQACDLFGTLGRFPTADRPGAWGDRASNDNRAQEALPEEVQVARQQGQLWALQAQTADLRRHLEFLREQIALA